MRIKGLRRLTLEMGADKPTFSSLLLTSSQPPLSAESPLIIHSLREIAILTPLTVHVHFLPTFPT